MNRIRTLRGRLTDNNVKRIIVDDGRPNHGYKVLDFRVWPQGVGTDMTYASLGLSYDMATIGQADDNRQIAWSASGSSSATPFAGGFSVIDPDHVVITDLYIVAINATVDPANYMIVVEPITLNDDEAILALIKERSQDDIR